MSTMVPISVHPVSYTHLLRTKIRGAIEFLDQLYLYGEAGQTKINELGRETFEEDVPSLDELDCPDQ